MLRIGRLGVVLAVLALAWAAPASADNEPNDGLVQAEGSLKGGQVYTGGLPTPNDRDWYVFYATSQQQLDITVTRSAPQNCCDRLDLILRDADGEFISDVRVYDEEAHIRYTTPIGTNRFYIEVDGPAGSNYAFRIEPAAAVVDGPTWGTATETGEPNETSSQASGLLAGGTLYAGAIQTENDVDWFVFHTLGRQRFDVSVVMTHEEDCCYVRAALVGPKSGVTLASTTVAENRIGHITRTSSPGITRYYLRVESEVGSTYQLRIDPADSLTQKPVEPCQDARRDEATHRSRIKKLDKKIKKARTRARKAELRAKRKKEKKRLAAATERVAEACGP